jgi:hypothetical protein
MNQYIRRSAITGKKYDVFDDVIILVNPSQAAWYVSKNVNLLDVRLGNDKKTGNPILLYLFKRSETKEVFDEWCKRNEVKKDV